jgi:hypothetical protein
VMKRIANLPHKRIWAMGCLLAAALSLGAIRHQLHSPHEPGRAFYFWKTRWTESSALSEALAQNRVSKLYMRFFDVRWNEPTASAVPVSPLKVSGALPGAVEIVPVVYLVNAVFLNIKYENIEALSEQVWSKVSAMAADNGVVLRELQLDCDWSDLSRRNYFHFAELLHRKLKAKQISVSSTLRLHQIKYYERTGIPPVSRGMLMFYNFGRIQADSERSSIFNAEDARRYTSHIARYPLPTDIVLPLFSWTVHSRSGKVLGLLEKLEAADIGEDFEKVAENRFRAKRKLFFRGRYFMDGDLLLMEQTTPDVTRQAARLARSGAGWRKNFDTVALFDLDERNLKQYAATEINSILGEF